MPIDIGSVIKALRKEKGMSQLQLAEALHTTQQTLSRYENNIRRPDYETIVEIADILNVPTSYFLRPEDYPPDIRRSNELYHLRQAVHDDPDMLTLFGLAKKCSPTELRQTIRIIRSLIGDDD